MIACGAKRKRTFLVGSFGAGVTTILLVASAAAAGPAGAAQFHRGPTRLIDTRIVVGFPQHAPAPVGVLAATRRAPAVTQQPSSVTVTAGSPASFSAGASGTPTPRVQWQDSTDGGSRWSSISRATSTTYSFPSTTVAQSGTEYRAVFRNRSGSATTDAATLTVSAASGAAPTVTQQPSSVTVTAGSPASFSAGATGTPTPTVQWQDSTDGGSTWNSVSGATSTTYSIPSTTVAQSGTQYQAVFSNAEGSATTDAATLTVSAASPPLVESSNWSGYADTGGEFSSVTAAWTVPALSCSSRSSSYSAQWVGIDGYSSSTVEQDGTEADCLGSSPSYDAWYEMYGDASVNSGYEVELSNTSNPVSPGDVMSASVSVSGATWTLAIRDESPSHGWSFSTNVSFSGGAQSSAEWIVERPEVCSFRCSLTSLANFGTVTFTNALMSSASAANNPISTGAYEAMEMVNGSTPLAVPSTLSGSGSGFSDTWKAA
ncbi:MAG: G1 family glutamic endopeptidase [Acidimicrobiales bacterium]